MAVSVTNIGTNFDAGTGATVLITVPGGGVPAGATIVVASCERTSLASNTNVCSDTAGNTYAIILRGAKNGANANGFGKIQYAFNVAALNSGDTITYNKRFGTSDITAVSALYITGLTTGDPLDPGASVSNNGSSTSPTVTSFTPAGANELFVGFVASNGNTSTYTQDSNFSTPFNEASSGTASTDARVNGGTFINTGINTVTFAPTYGVTGTWYTVICAFIPLAAASQSPNVIDNPVRARSSVPSIEAQEQGSPHTILLGQDRIYGGPGQAPTYLFQNPMLPVPRKASWDTQLEGSPGVDANLKGQDKIYGGPGQVPSYDYQNPVRPISRTAAIQAQILGTALILGLAGLIPNAQRDWPNPTLRPSSVVAINAQPQGSPSLLVDLAGQDQFFGLGGPDYDYKNPILPISRVVSVNAQPNGTPSVLIRASAEPDYETDFPNPVLRVSQRAVNAQPPGTPPLLLELVGQDQFFGLAGNPNFDWPNPVLPKSRISAIEAQPQGTPFELASSAQPPLRQGDWQNPILPGSHRAVNSQPCGSPSLLVDLAGSDAFFGLAGKPNFDQPNPNPAPSRTPAIVAQPLGTPDALIQSLFVSFNIATLDWPNPVLRPSFTPSINAQPQGSIHGILLGQDQFFGAPGMGPDYDYTNPMLPVSRTAAMLAQPNGLPVAAQFLATPASLLDWPNPTLPVSRAVASNTQPLGTPGVLGVLVGQDVMFGAPGQVPDYDQTLPVQPGSRTAAINAQLLGSAQTLQNATPAPFAQTNWPNPVLRVSQHAVFSQYWLGTRGTTVLRMKDKFYGLGGQVPTRRVDNPVLPVSRMAAMLAQPNGLPLAGVIANPFAQNDWPNPVLPISRIQSILAQPNGTSPEEGVFVPPFAQLDWPNPTLPLSKLQALVAQPLGTSPEEGVLALPFNELDWPNPNLRISSVSALGAQPLGTPFLITLPPPPFYEWDWQNPLRRVLHISQVSQHLGSRLGPILMTDLIQKPRLSASEIDANLDATMVEAMLDATMIEATLEGEIDL